jgi:uncharacterized membrane protein YccC
MAKLPMNTELGAVAVLILVTAFHTNMLRQFVNNAVGKLVALAVVAYVWKTYSKLVAFFLAIAVVTAMCKEGFEYMCDEKTAKAADTEDKCKTASGTWDEKTKKCKC